jgi:hypothetical protein
MPVRLTWNSSEAAAIFNYYRPNACQCGWFSSSVTIFLSHCDNFLVGHGSLAVEYIFCQRFLPVPPYRIGEDDMQRLTACHFVNQCGDSSIAPNLSRCRRGNTKLCRLFFPNTRHCQCPRVDSP